jgi:hypothetical protein
MHINCGRTLENGTFHSPKKPNTHNEGSINNLCLVEIREK